MHACHNSQDKYDHIKNPVKNIDNVRVGCNLCNGVIYRDEIPRHFTKFHKEFCVVRNWPSCDKCMLYFQKKENLVVHNAAIHTTRLTSSIANSVANLPKGTSV